MGYAIVLTWWWVLTCFSTANSVVYDNYHQQNFMILNSWCLDNKKDVGDQEREAWWCYSHCSMHIMQYLVLSNLKCEKGQGGHSLADSLVSNVLKEIINRRTLYIWRGSLCVIIMVSTDMQELSLTETFIIDTIAHLSLSDVTSTETISTSSGILK